MQQQIVVVTGAARRIGAATARILHAAGACLVLHYRRAAPEAQVLAETLNAARAGSAIAVPGDLAEPATWDRLADTCQERFGRLDALVNNASSFFATPLGQIDEPAWADLIGSNLKAPLFLTQRLAPLLRIRGGSVVNITDIHAERPIKGYPVYCAAKAGLLGLTRALAVELAPEVRVNAVAPGPVLWPEDAQFADESRTAIVAHTLLGRTGCPEDVARAVLFLLRDAPYVTGQVINVDGGRTARL